MEITIDDAKAVLPDLIEKVRLGEGVVFVRDGRRVARLVPATKSGFRFGGLEDKLTGPGPDWFEPMSEEELLLWEGGNERSR